VRQDEGSRPGQAGRPWQIRRPRSTRAGAPSSRRPLSRRPLSRVLAPAGAAFLVSLFAGLPVVGPGFPLVAQIAAPPAPTPAVEPGSELRVYLMTMGEGDQVYERFGHNAIWIHDPVAGTDHTYNWGLFDFDQPGFIREFIQGRMWYWMDAFPARLTAESYRLANRSVWVQELNLTPAQRRALVERLEWNRLPENRFYRYDYYYDNCSTRVRDALDFVLDGQIREQTADLPAGETFRTHTRRLTTNDVAIYTGLMAGLGPAVDRPISVWEEMFLPLAMRESVRDLTVTDADGRRAPLVLAEETLFVAERPPPPATPPRWWPGYLAAGLALAALILTLGQPAAHHAVARAALAGVAGAWLLAAGVLGVVLAGLWGLTDHAAAYRNENLFQFNPLALALLVLLPLFLYRPRRFDRWALVVAATVAGLSVLGVVVKVFPWFRQVNGELLVLAVPVHVAIALVVWLAVRRRESGANPPGVGG
jgi:hypothetical protein